MLGRRPAREARHGQIEAAPEEVHGATLADEPSPKLFEDSVCLHQDSPEPVGIFPIVRGVGLVTVEGDGVRNFVGPRVEIHMQTELSHLFLEAPVERRDRLGLERKTTYVPVARLDRELMSDEIEVDLECPVSVWDRRGREPAGRDQQRNMPGMIDPGTLGDPNLADDLHPHVQGGAGLAPSLEG